MAKDTRIAFRVSDEKKERLAAVAKLVGLTETALAEACVDALIDYIETHHEIRMPLAIVPKTSAAPHAATAKAVGIVHPRSGSTAAPRLKDDTGALSLNDSPARAPRKKRASTKS